MSRNLKLDAGGDLCIPPIIGDFIEQRVASAFRMLLGEWFLDTTDGTPYFQTIFVANANLDHVRSAFIDRALSVEGVVSIETLDLSVDKVRRELTVHFAGRGPLGQLVVVDVGP